MKKEIRDLRVKLDGKYLTVFDEINYIISSDFYNERKLVEVQKDILGMLIESQERGIDVKEVVGEDLEEFCSEILKDNKSNPIIVMLELIIIMIGIISFILLIRGLIDLKRGGIQYLYYDSLKFLFMTHDIKRNFTLMIGNYLIFKVPIFNLIIILIYVFIIRSSFKMKNIRILTSIFINTLYPFNSLLALVFENKINSLDSYIEVKITYIVIIFILSIFSYYILKKYKNKYPYKIS